MPRVLLLIPSASYRAHDFLAAAGRLGLDVAVASDVGQPLNAFPERSLTADFSDVEAGAATIARYADSYPVDAIVPVDDGGTALAARASELLRLPANAPTAVGATRNKAELRQLLAEAGLPSPAFRVCAFNEDAAAVATELSFPVVVKPLALAGSRGVMRADDAGAFVAVVERLRRMLEQPATAAACGATADRYLVEGYLPGDEVALEGLLLDGSLQVLALFDKPDRLEGPFFEETIYVTPSRLTAERQAEIREVSARAALALGLTRGPLHVELRLNDAGAFPIDIASRTIGGHCARCLRFDVGEGAGAAASLEEIVLRQAVGLSLERLERETPASGVMMIPTPGAGRLHAVHGLEEARGVPLVSEVTIATPLGHLFVPLPEGGAYPGFIFARAETPEAVVGALRASHARLRFELEPV
ncbi:MAG: Biotin carboxylase [Chloroflexi bacterium]|nr:MAG: Biotin carboxylase [Chloroflexota bacterium]